MTISPKLLKILACPKCKQAVEMSSANDYINCLSCQLSFPIRDDIPVMLLDEAQALEG